jgi:hypothetical protein
MLSLEHIDTIGGVRLVINTNIASAWICYYPPSFNTAYGNDWRLYMVYLGLHDGCRAWKGFDWDAMDRLYQKGLDFPRWRCGRAAAQAARVDRSFILPPGPARRRSGRGPSCSGRTGPADEGGSGRVADRDTR